MLQRWQKIDLVQTTADSMEEVPDQIAQLNREQLFAGEYEDGSAISPGYTRFTILQKQIKGQPYNRVTLKDTGEFYSRLYLILKGKTYDFFSDDSKTLDLVKKYNKSGDIFGLTNPHKKDTWNIVQPIVVTSLKQQTGTT